jgi:hypothetical protein
MGSARQLWMLISGCPLAKSRCSIAAPATLSSVAAAKVGSSPSIGYAYKAIPKSSTTATGVVNGATSIRPRTCGAKGDSRWAA